MNETVPEVPVILDNQEIVWTPIFASNAVGVALKQWHALSCRKHRPSDMQAFKDEVWRRMGGTGHTPSDFLDIKEGILPYCFYKGSRVYGLRSMRCLLPATGSTLCGTMATTMSALEIRFGFCEHSAHGQRQRICDSTHNPPARRIFILCVRSTPL